MFPFQNLILLPDLWLREGTVVESAGKPTFSPIYFLKSVCGCSRWDEKSSERPLSLCSGRSLIVELFLNFEALSKIRFGTASSPVFPRAA